MRLSLLGLVAFAAAVIALASCDASPLETQTDDVLQTTPIPVNGRLLDPSDDDPGGVALRRGAGGASAYGCLVSTLRADGTGPAYDYDAVYLHFPQRLVREAEGRMTYVTLALRSERAPTHAATRFSATGGVDEGAGLVRVARCRVPQTPEVARLVKTRLQRFRSRSWAGGRGAASNQSRQGASIESGRTASASANASSSTCAEWVEVWFCRDYKVGDLEWTECEFEGYECTRYVSTWDDGWGGGDPGSGDDPDPCTYDGGPTGQLCEEGGGTVPPSTPPPPPPSNTDDYVPDNPDPDCTNPVALWERAFCQSKVPNSAERAIIVAAINNIRNRGGVCLGIANQATVLLNLGDLRLYDNPGSYAGGWAWEDFGMILDRTWVDNYSSAISTQDDGTGALVRRNLEQMIAHEADHYMLRDRSHLDFKNFRTLNSAECSGFPEGRVVS